VKLRAINSGIAIEGIVADLTAGNIATLAEGMDVLVDGTDNFETRFLLNDYAVREERSRGSTGRRSARTASP
jgi:adenylyltransferase/sulfurtransferase